MGFDCSGDHLWVNDGGSGVLCEYMTDAFGITTPAELARPDFTALAEAFGIPATLSSPATLQADLAQHLATPGPSAVVLPAVLKPFAPTRL